MIIVPLLAFGQVLKPSTSKISFDFMDADVRNVLRVLSEVSKKNIVIAEDVKGKVTIKLENVTYDEALDVILLSNDLARIEEGNVIRVVTAKRFYDERDRNRKDRVEILKEKDAKQKLEDEFVTETLFLNYLDVTEVGIMLRGMPGRGSNGHEYQRTHFAQWRCEHREVDECPHPERHQGKRPGTDKKGQRA